MARLIAVLLLAAVTSGCPGCVPPERTACFQPADCPPGACCRRSEHVCENPMVNVGGVPAPRADDVPHYCAEGTSSSSSGGLSSSVGTSSRAPGQPDVERLGARCGGPQDCTGTGITCLPAAPDAGVCAYPLESCDEQCPYGTVCGAMQGQAGCVKQCNASLSAPCPSFEACTIVENRDTACLATAAAECRPGMADASACGADGVCIPWLGNAFGACRRSCAQCPAPAFCRDGPTGSFCDDTPASAERLRCIVDDQCGADEDCVGSEIRARACARRCSAQDGGQCPSPDDVCFVFGRGLVGTRDADGGAIDEGHCFRRCRLPGPECRNLTDSREHALFTCTPSGSRVEPYGACIPTNASVVALGLCDGDWECPQDMLCDPARGVCKPTCGGNGNCLAAGMQGYCPERSRDGGLPWQMCMY